MKSISLHKIFRVEAINLAIFIYTWKIVIFVNMWNLGQFRENWYFVNNCLIKVEFKNLFAHCVTHITVIIFRTVYFISTYSGVYNFMVH